MKNEKNLQPCSKLSALTGLSVCVFAIGALSATGAAHAADSARLQWDTNGHYYQLFEGAPITWPDAKTACEGKSAHLATITSETENGFIYSQFLKGRDQYAWYHIGGSSKDTYAWAWITGESFKGYTNWGNESAVFPHHDANKNYLAILVNYTISKRYYQEYGLWENTTADSKATGYICEWSTDNHIDSTMVPDMNGNGVDEVAVLFVDYKTGKHTVSIKDPASKALLKTLAFATSFTPPSGLVALQDTNGNKAPEIGVLFTQFRYPSVQIKDTKSGAKVRDITFMTPSYAPKSVSISPSLNLSGVNDIAVVGINRATGAAQAEVRDSKTGDISNSVKF